MISNDDRPRTMQDVQEIRTLLHREITIEISNRLLARMGAMERTEVEEQAARDCDLYGVEYDPIYAVEIMLDRAGYTLSGRMPPFPGQDA